MTELKKSNGGPSKTDRKIKVTKDGPFIISGDIPLAKNVIISDENGVSIGWERGESYPGQESYALCRCGGSKDKPFCDGSHNNVGFNGSETASRAPYLDRAKVINGPTLRLTDAKDLCGTARFCHQSLGAWDLTRRSDDPRSREKAIKVACDCPAGRLVIWDKETGKPIEPSFEESIDLIEHPRAGVSGPLWVKGGIPIESEDGEIYEVRNRVTLCRCGRSENKPFCDGSHISIGFSDGDSSIRKKE